MGILVRLAVAIVLAVFVCGMSNKSAAQRSVENRSDPAGVWRGSVTCDFGTIEFEAAVSRRTGASHYEGTYRVLSAPNPYRQMEGREKRLSLSFNAHGRSTSFMLQDWAANAWDRIAIQGTLGKNLSTFPYPLQVMLQNTKGYVARCITAHVRRSVPAPELPRKVPSLATAVRSALSAAEGDWDNKRQTHAGRILRQHAPEAAQYLDGVLASGTNHWIAYGDLRFARYIHGAFEQVNDRVKTLEWRDRWLLLEAMAGIDGDFASNQGHYLLISDVALKKPELLKKYFELAGRHTSCPGESAPYCIIKKMGTVLRAGTAVQSGLVLDRQATGYADEGGTASVRLEARLVEALAWWEEGGSARVGVLLSELQPLFALRQANLPLKVQAAYHALTAAYFESQLRFSEVATEFQKSLAAVRRSEHSGNSMDLINNTRRLLVDLTRRHLERRQRCPTCRLMDRPVSDFIEWLANGLPPNGAPGAAYLLMGATPTGFLSTSVRRHIDGSVFISNASPSFRRARGSSLASALHQFINNGTSVADVLKLVTAKRRSQALVWRKKTLDVYIDNDGEFGDFSGLMTNVVNFAQGLADNNHAFAAEVSIDRLARLWFYGWDAERRTPTREQNIAFATRLAPLFAKLGEYKSKGRPLTTFPDYLRAAVEMIDAKLDWEWQVSSLNAVPAVRELRPAASVLAKLLLAAQPGDARLRHEMHSAGFRLLQIAMLSDTAASLNVAVQRSAIERRGALELVARRQELLLDIGVYEAAAREQKNFIKPYGAEQAAARARAELEVVNTAIAAKGLGIAGLVTNASIQTLENAARLLGPDEVALLVQTDENSTAVVAVEPSGEISYRRVDLDREQLERAVAEIRRGLVVSERGYSRFSASKAHILYRQVFADFSGKLESAKRIISVISGPLQALPLAVFVTQPPKIAEVSELNARDANIAWLAMKAAETRTPSLGSHAKLIGDQAIRSGQVVAFLGIGNPVLASSTAGNRNLDIDRYSGSKTLADVERLRSLASLPETAAELRAISETLGGTSVRLLLGNDATESEIKASRLNTFNILAFATHGVVAGQAFEGSEPGLVLTPPRQQTEQDDGFLSMSEIARLRLNAELVLLSACDTATSDGRPLADGLSGLARAFFVAGARNLIATHWSIPSLPTIAVTTNMMRDYIQQKSIAAVAQSRAHWAYALNSAQKAMIKNIGPSQFAHPASWGAFQVIGAN